VWERKTPVKEEGENKEEMVTGSMDMVAVKLATTILLLLILSPPSAVVACSDHYLRKLGHKAG